MAESKRSNMKIYSNDYGMDRYDYLRNSFHVDVDFAFRGRRIPNWPHCFTSLTFRHETDVLYVSGERGPFNKTP